MKILILGNDGYIGYPLTLHLLKKGYKVFGVDDYSRRRRVNEVNSDSLTPILSAIGRKGYLSHKYKESFIAQVDISLGTDTQGFIQSVLSSLKPDCIIHLAEMPSAPWSMRDAEYCRTTQQENIIGTLDLLWAMKEECHNAHLIKLGTMGEYGTPDCIIPEGEIPKLCQRSHIHHVDKIGEVKYHSECPMEGLLFPRSPNSFYHLSKVHDTHNIIFACRNWEIRSTDIMQGVVFGLGYEGTDMVDEELTRFDYDEYFGTALNRFCAQAIIGHPLTVYGKGDQQRGFLPLQDSIDCLTIAIENPPDMGEYRTFNQFENIYSINKLTDMVCKSAMELGLDFGIEYINNPRNELEEHYYNPQHQKLLDLGYKPTEDIQGEITTLIRRLLPYKDRIIEKVIMPKTNWR